MCPMRVFLILFSAILACYLAWRNYSKNDQLSLLHESEQLGEDSKAVGADGSASKQQIRSKLSASFWTLVDMASGRYLWKGIKSLESATESKNS
ncbi:unnamed protein product [Calypogeia fissa]